MCCCYCRSTAERLDEDDYDVIVTDDTSFGGDIASLPSASRAADIVPSHADDALFTNDYIQDDEFFSSACEDGEMGESGRRQPNDEENEDVIIDDFDD